MSSEVAALWFPDWPCHALRVEDKVVGPAAIVAEGRVHVCNQEARARGVRRGMKARQAQAVCPELAMEPVDTERDARVFTPVVDGLDAVASSVEVLRPGLVVIDAGAAERFHGPAAQEMLLDAAALTGIDVFIGVAAEITTAVIAARVNTVVHDSAEFLARQPVDMLAVEPVLGCDKEVVRALKDVGIARLGDLTALSSKAVQTRFGVAGKRCYDIARGESGRRVAPPLPEADLSVTMTPPDPIARVDEVAFAGRQLAAALHQRLRETGVSCLRLAVRVELVDGRELERVWRTKDALDENATADRVRWQLDGWLNSGGSGPVRAVTLTPVEVSQPEEFKLCGEHAGEAGAEAAQAARRVAQRVQSTLGVDAVVQPRLVGGRGVAERVEFVPFGEYRDPVEQASWPGQLPSPLPSRLELAHPGLAHPASRITLVSPSAQQVYVTAEALLSEVPAGLAWGKNRYAVTGWAGPWPVDGRWWTGEQRLARLQVVGEDREGAQRAWLLQWAAGTWRVEATYV